MKDDFVDSGCNRASDLIGFLYGEISQTEASAFQHHLQDCLYCQSDLVAFGGIRQSVAEWRLEALGTSAVSNKAYLPSKPSGLVAIREFFKLSPPWMKGAVAFASLLFCLFAVLAFGRLTEHSSSTPLKAMNPEPVQEVTSRQVAEVENKDSLSEEGAQVTVAAAPNRDRQRVTRRERVAPRNESTAKRRPLTQAEREQLAADLRLTSDIEEPELDLIADRLNRD